MACVGGTGIENTCVKRENVADVDGVKDNVAAAINIAALRILHDGGAFVFRLTFPFLILIHRRAEILRVIDATLVIFRIDILPDSVFVFYPERNRDLFPRIIAGGIVFTVVFRPESIFVCVARKIHQCEVRKLVIRLNRSVRAVAQLFVHRLAKFCRTRIFISGIIVWRNRNASKFTIRVGVIIKVFLCVVFFRQRGKIYAKRKPPDCKVAVNVHVALHPQHIVGRADDKVAVGINTACHAFQNNGVEYTRLHHAFTVFSIKTVD